jgi:hypothetical protein
MCSDAAGCALGAAARDAVAAALTFTAFTDPINGTATTMLAQKIQLLKRCPIFTRLASILVAGLSGRSVRPLT